jgi:CelD/BcsL family acetyltransferase involved in cellulose biosynthesis
MSDPTEPVRVDPGRPPEAPGADAAARTVRLKFLLGELPLFSVGFELCVLSTHFTRLGRNPEETRDALEPTADGILLRSHPVAERLPRVSRKDEFVRYVPSQYERRYIDLDGTFEDYLKRFSAKSRSTLRRKVRKFGQLCGGEPDWRTYRTRKETEEFYRLARDVSRKTYQERLLDAGLPESDEFRKKMLAAAERDETRGYLLFHESKPVAYLHCPLHDGVAFYGHLGYDPEYAKWSPGTVLQHLALEQLFAEGDARMFDFTEGEGRHKSFFATHSALCADIYYLRRSLRNRLLVRLHSGLEAFSRALVRLLNRLGLKERIKRLIRRKS